MHSSWQVGNLSLKRLHYGTSHSACGSLFQLSCGTVDGELFMTLQFAEPIVSRSMAKAFLEAVAKNLRAGCGIPTQVDYSIQGRHFVA